MQTILVALQLLLGLGLIGLILIQHGKGADMGAAFGSGASATVFGSRGSGSFLSRTTALLATLFFLTSMALGYFAMQTSEQKSLMEGYEPVPAAETLMPASDIPAAPMPESAPEAFSEIPVAKD